VFFWVHTKQDKKKCWQKDYECATFHELFNTELEKRIDRWWRKNCSTNATDITYGNHLLRHLFPYEQAIYRDMLRGALAENFFKDVARYIEFTSTLITSLEADAVAIWNGLTFYGRAVSAVARECGVRVYYLERGYFPDSLIVDERGVNYGGSVGQTWQSAKDAVNFGQQDRTRVQQFLKEFCQRGQSVVGARPKSPPHAVRASLGISDSQRAVLYVAQIDTDTNNVFFSPLYKNNEEVIRELVHVIRRFPEGRLLVKLHPEDADRSQEFRSLLGDEGSLVGSVNVHSLLEAADVVVVRNSTAGLEALAYLKPVMVLGQAIYSEKGFTYDVRERGHLEVHLARLLRNPTIPPDSEEDLYKFFYLLLRHYLYFFPGKEVFRGGNREIERRIGEARCNGARRSSRGRETLSEKTAAHLLSSSGAHMEWADLLGVSKLDRVFLLDTTSHESYRTIVHALMSTQRVQTISVLKHHGIEREFGPPILMEDFTTSNLVKHLLVHYDAALLLTESGCAIHLKALLYFRLVRGTVKIWIDPLNLSRFLPTSVKRGHTR
jgi:hypothetical protein